MRRVEVRMVTASSSFTISAPVGEKGKNQREDVLKVQDALNAIPPAAGGQSILLSPDGVAGPKTKKAIQEFQLAHFGWKIADSRVDPGGKTWEKLVSLLAVYGGTDWSIKRVEHPPIPGKPLRSIDSHDRFYEVRDKTGLQRALFLFATPDQSGLGRNPALPQLQARDEYNWFRTAAPCSVYAFAGPGSHSHLSPTPDRVTISLRVRPVRPDLAPGNLNLEVNHQWLVPTSTPGVRHVVEGSLRFVRSGCVDPAARKKAASW
jgi:hypothetical protein